MEELKRGSQEMITAGASASLAVLITNPLDVVKTRLQMNNELTKNMKSGNSYRGLFHCFTATYQAEGVAGLQRGLNVAVLREFGKCAFRIGMYDPLSRFLTTSLNINVNHSNQNKVVEVGVKIFSAVISGITAALLFNPLDLAKSRTQASSSKLSASHHTIEKNASVWSILKSIAKPVGSDKLEIKRWWYGTRISAIRSAVFTPVMLLTNSSIKQFLNSSETKTEVMKISGFNKNGYLVFSEVTAPLVASFFAVLSMNPFDVVRTRLYNQPNDSKRLYLNSFDCFLKILRSEGLLAFWKGTGSHFLRVGPHTVLTFIFMGQFRSLLKI